jgi:hypothetical protein
LIREIIPCPRAGEHGFSTRGQESKTIRLVLPGQDKKWKQKASFAFYAKIHYNVV